MTLRKRNDGCGVVSDGNDWIVDCAIQAPALPMMC